MLFYDEQSGYFCYQYQIAGARGPELVPITIDLAKSEKRNGQEVTIAEIDGIASSEAPDEDGDELVQKGIDWIDCTFFSYEHPLTIMTAVGEPLEFILTEHEGFPATRVKGELWLAKPLAKEIYETCQVMQKSAKRAKIGLSVEGKISKGQRQGKRVLTSKMWSIAITTHPRHKASLGTTMTPLMASMRAEEEFQRSITMGYPGNGYSFESNPGSVLGPIAGNSANARSGPSPTRNAMLLEVLRRNRHATLPMAERHLDNLLARRKELAS